MMEQIKIEQEKRPAHELPQALIAKAKEDEFIKKQLEHDAGVWEGYSIEEHALMVMTQFEKYFAGKPLPAGLREDFFRQFFLLHDIGKAQAIDEGDKHNQYGFNHQFFKNIAEQRQMDEREMEIGLALLDSDVIGDYIRGRKDLASIVEKLSSLAQKAKISPTDLLKVFCVYYLCDAGSYTKDSTIEGVVQSKESLDKLFRFDPDHGQMDFAPDLKEKISILEKAL